MSHIPIFQPYTFGEQEKTILDRDGHFLLPGILTTQARQRLTQSLAHVQGLMPGTVEGHKPSSFAAEHDLYLESLIAHPQLLALARKVLGEEIRFDHCVTLNRRGNDNGSRWHSHEYSDDDPSLGFVRIFFYVSGFDVDDGGLKAVPGSHHYRDPKIHAETDEALKASWMVGKKRPSTGEPLEIQDLSAPPGTVALMWTHAAHAVSPRRPESGTRWTVVYAYRNPGRPSHARWLTEEFERKPITGAEGLMSLY